MEQKILEKPKQQVLKERLNSLSSSLDENQKVKTISFGSNGRNSCDSVQVLDQSLSSFKSWLNDQTPDEYAKTPLGLAIEKAIGEIKKDSIPNIIVITDGHDTCGKDPCESIRKLGKKLQEFNKNLSIDIVGYDIKNKDKQLNCYMSDIANVDFNYFQARSDMELKAQLAQIDDKFKQKILNSMNASDRLNQEFGANSSKGQNQNLSEEQKKALKAGIVKVIEAPDTVEFLALKGGTRLKLWEGSFGVQLPAGKTIIQIKDNPIKKIEINVVGGQTQSIRYSDLLGINTANLTIKNSPFQLELRPIKETPKKKEEQRTTRFSFMPKKTEKKVDARKSLLIENNKKIQVEAGKWVLSVRAPWWLDGPLNLDIEIIANQDRELNMAQIYSNKIQWIQSPNKDIDHALILNGIYGGDLRVLVKKDQVKVPIPTQWSWYWVSDSL